MNDTTSSQALAFISGMLRLLAVTGGFAAAALAAPAAQAQTVGSIDPGFGAVFGFDGFAYFDGLSTADVRGRITTLIALPDGGVLAGGPCKLPPAFTANWSCLYRWPGSDAALYPDMTFGANGVSYVLADADVTRIVQRKDGRIWTVANCATGTGYFWCSAVVNANGSGFDTSYGSAGVSQIPRPAGYGNMYIIDIALQPDGKLLIAGTCYLNNVGPSSSFCLARLTVNGAFDATFGSGNWVTTTPALGDELRKVTLLSDGGFYATGMCGDTIPTRRICNVRYSPNGVLVGAVESSWGTNLRESVNDVRERGGKVTIVGVADVSGRSRIYANRYDWTSQTGDPTFGGNYPATGTAGDINIDSSNDGDAFLAKILRDGSIYFHGKCNNQSNLCTARFTANGLLDSGYGVGGRYEYVNSIRFGAGAAYVDSVADEAADGKVLVGGYCVDSGGIERPCVRRYLGGPNTAKVCTMDIDGDGVVNPTTDGLLLARISLGLKGNAALAGAIAPGATRTTWTQVRDYLFNECSMPVAP